MEIPKKISPDNIKDSIIEIKYLSNTPFEILLGLIFKSIDDTYKYTNRPLSRNQNANNTLPNFNQGITLAFNSPCLFYNDKIKVNFQPNSIVINCLDQYLGWEIYLNEIKKIIHQISKVNEIQFYTCIGLRYISQYHNKDLKDIVNFNFSIGIKDLNSNSYSFSSEFIKNECSVILNLHSKIPTSSFGNEEESIISISTIDIDVINDKKKVSSIDELIILIDTCHASEKEIFFNILNEDFLKTLNPQY